MRINRAGMIMGAGCGVGVITAHLVKQYDAPVPFIGGYLPYPWGNYSTLGLILTGAITFGISQFTNIIKNTDLNIFVTTFGATTLFSGFMNGIFGPPVVRAGPVMQQVAARAAGPSVAPITPTGIPQTAILA